MATEERLIRADVTAEAFTKWLTSRYDGRMPADIVDEIPTADAVEVVHGHWIEHSHLEVGGECSVCGWQFQWFENAEARYCPHCGAKMDGDGNDR